MEKLLSVAEAAERLGVSARRVRQLIDGGDLEAARVGRAWMVQPGSVERRRLQPAALGRPLDRQRVWSFALLADELVDRMMSEVGGQSANDLLRHEEDELARRLEWPLRHLKDLEPDQVAGDQRQRAGLERALREALAALRNFNQRERAVHSYAPALFDVQMDVPPEERAQPQLFGLAGRDERAAMRKLRNSLAHGEVDPEHLAPFRNRSDGVDGFYGHMSVLPSLESHANLVLSGPHAAHHYGADVVPGDELDAYVNADVLDSLAKNYGLEDAPLEEANIWLRPVSEFHLERGLAPRLLVAADLLERADARRRSAAFQLLEAVIAAIRWDEGR